MRTWLLTISVVGLLMIPFAAEAADYGSSPSNNGTIPPVAQPLVREGDFAIRLAAQLDLGTPSDEATAEDLLARADVAPANGWLPDYPMTPQIIGQLQDAVSRSASEGKLPMTADQAVNRLFLLAAQYNLPTPAEPLAPADDNAQAATPPQAGQTVINNYYDGSGPPVITYYPPPPDYLYLYAWVPYPAWWFGSWYPGFYICNRFTTVVVVHSRSVVVTNHFVDHHRHTVVFVDPNGGRGASGRGRPDSVLRTGRGERFRTFVDMRSGAALPGPTAGERNFPNERGTGTGRFSSAEARRGAASIYSRSTAAEAVRAPGSYSRQRIERGVNVSAPTGRYHDRPVMRENAVSENRFFEPVRHDRNFEGRSSQGMPGNGQHRSFNSGAVGADGGGQVRSFSDKQGSGRADMGGGSTFQGGSYCRGRC